MNSSLTVLSSVVVGNSSAITSFNSEFVAVNSSLTYLNNQLNIVNSSITNINNSLSAKQNNLIVENSGLTFDGVNLRLNLDGSTLIKTVNGIKISDSFINSLSGSTSNLSIGAANGLSLSGQTLSLQTANSALTGALTSTDYNIFNNKQDKISVENSGLTFNSGNLSIDLDGTSLVKSNGGLKISDHLNDTVTLDFSNQISLVKMKQESSGILLSDEIFTPIPSTSISDGNSHFLFLRLNGFNATFSGFTFLETQLTELDTTTDFVNVILLFKLGSLYYYTIVNSYLYTEPDVNPPIITFSLSGLTQNHVTLSITSNEISTAYYSLYTSGSTIKTVDEIINGTDAILNGNYTLSVGTTNHLLTGLTYLNSYDIRYFARDLSSNDSLTGLTSFQTLDRYVINTPSDVNISSMSQTSIILAWSNVTDNAGYNIFGSDTSGGTFNLIKTNLTDVTGFNESGLTMNQIRWYKIQTIGNNTTNTISILSIPYSGQTSNIVQLATPILYTTSVLSDTNLTLNWSAVTNTSSWLLEYSLNGTSGFNQIGGTISSSTYTYNHTGLTYNTQYFYRLTAVGNDSTFSNSNPSTVVNSTTKQNAPFLISGYTSTGGLTVSYLFNKAINNPSGLTSLFSFSPVKTVSSVTLNSANTSMVNVVLSTAFASTDSITGIITSGLTPADGGMTYNGTSGYTITNNVLSYSSTAAIESITGIDGLFVSELNSDFELTGTTILKWISRVGTNRSLAHASGNRHFDLANKKISDLVGASYTTYTGANFPASGTNDWTIIFYENGSEAISQTLLSSYPASGNISLAVFGNYWIYSNSGTYAYISYTGVDSIRKHVITRSGTTFTWEINSVAYTCTNVSIISTDTFNNNVWGADPSNNRGGDFWAIVRFSKALNSTEKNTVLTTLNTVLGV